MNSEPKTWKDVWFGLAIVHVSLIAALTVRFLWAYFINQARTPESYWEFVHYSIIAFGNSVVPILIFGAFTFWFQGRFEQSFRRVVFLPRRISSQQIALSIFFVSMLALGTLLGHDFTFPRKTWGLAWAFAIGMSTTITITRRFSADTKQKFLYHRAYHFLIDAIIVTCSLIFAYLVRFDGIPPDPYHHQLFLVVPYFVVLYLGVNLLWGVYRFIWRFMGLRESLILVQSVASAALVLTLIRILILERFPSVRIPFGVLLAQPWIVCIGFIGARVLRRIQYNYWSRKGTNLRREDNGKKRVLLVGAGQAGLLLIRELEQRREFTIVGFLDDDLQKSRRSLNGIRVLGTTQELAVVVKGQKVEEVILCMPTAHKSVIRRIVAGCQAMQVKISTVPSLAEIILGKVAVGQFRPVRMEDLLGRPTIQHPAGDTELMESYRNRRILVTGAGGSIGAELVRQMKDFSPSQLILLDKDENNLYEIGLEIREALPGEMVEIVADIRDLPRMDRIFASWKPEVVFHAAAYKHVPMMESHPAEAILNNVIGTRNIVDISLNHVVRAFVLISTDKAVNPTNVMGASKRLAEMIVQSRARASGNTRFCCVRFGNVLGSRASVVPVFQKRIAQGKSIQVTHPEMQRYFMTIPEAVQLVIQAGSLGQKGEIFVLDMGDPVKIVDMARELIQLSGLIPDEDIPIEFTGIRPGEKLYEELLISNESGIRNTKYPKIFVAQALQNLEINLDENIGRLETAARADDVRCILQMLDSLKIGYRNTSVQGSAKHAHWAQ